MHRFCTVSRAQSTSGTSSSGSSVLNIAKLFGANSNNPCRLPRFVVCGITIIQVHFMCFRQQMFCSRRHYFHVQQRFVAKSSNLGIKTFKYDTGGKNECIISLQLISSNLKWQSAINRCSQINEKLNYIFFAALRLRRKHNEFLLARLHAVVIGNAMFD